LHNFFVEHVDENVDLTIIRDPNGPMGKTTWIAGRYRGWRGHMMESIMPLWSLFVEPIKYTLVDVIAQPSGENDPSERHLTKAVILLKGTATLRKTGGEWENHYAYDSTQ